MEGDPEEEGCQSDGDLRRKPVPSYGGTAFVVFILALAGFAFCLKKKKERKKERRSSYGGTYLGTAAKLDRLSKPSNLALRKSQKVTNSAITARR